MEYLTALAVGVGGWFISHLLATWRQSAANQSEWRWKLLSTYADVISSCNKAVNRGDHFRYYENEARRHPPNAIPEDIKARKHEARRDWLIAGEQVGAASVLLEVLEPMYYKKELDGVMNAMRRFANEVGDYEANLALEEFKRERDSLVRQLHEDLVRRWKPTGAIDMVKYRYRMLRYRLKNWREKRKNTKGEKKS